MLPSEIITTNKLAVLPAAALRLIDKLFQDKRVATLEECAYILATVKHETANTFLPIREIGEGKFMKYGTTYYGRGYVQITWQSNYAEFSRLLGIDLIDDPKDPNDNADPDKALEPAIAYEIMILGMTKGLFTGKKLDDYINEIEVDYVNARRIINGTDQAQLIASYAEFFEKLLLKAYVNGKC